MRTKIGKFKFFWMGYLVIELILLFHDSHTVEKTIGERGDEN
jgi:hypothetical protein